MSAGAAVLPRLARRRTRLAAGLAVGAAGAAAAAVALLGGGGERPVRATAPVGSAAVERRDLVEEETFNGRLGFRDARPVNARGGGTLTRLPASGAAIGRGTALYEVDGTPTAHLMYGSRPAWRELRQGMRGEDVRQLEDNLAALGYLGIAPDSYFGDATAAAVKAWQEDRGARETGRVALGEVVFMPGRRRIAKREARVGDALQPGAPVLLTTSTQRVATADVEASRQSLLRPGDAVQVELPSGRLVRGRVARVASSADPPKGEDGESTVAVTIALRRTRGRVLDQAPVTIVARRAEKRNALSVPVAALLARRGGGYAVELVEGRRRRLVPVRLGEFASGYVEVSSRSLRAGMRVVVPR